MDLLSRNLKIAFVLSSGVLAGCAAGPKVQTVDIEGCTEITTDNVVKMVGEGDERKEVLVPRGQTSRDIPDCYAFKTTEQEASVRKAAIDAKKAERLEVITGFKEASIIAVEGMTPEGKAEALEDIRRSLNNVLNPEDVETTVEALKRTGKYVERPDIDSECEELEGYPGVLLCQEKEQSKGSTPTSEL